MARSHLNFPTALSDKNFPSRPRARTHKKPKRIDHDADEREHVKWEANICMHLVNEARDARAELLREIDGHLARRKELMLYLRDLIEDRRALNA